MKKSIPSEVKNTIEMFTESTEPVLNRIDILKKNILRAESTLKSMCAKKGMLIQSIAVVRKENNWTRENDLKSDMAKLDRKIKTKEEDICYMQKDLMYSFWPPRSLEFNKQEHLQELRKRIGTTSPKREE